MQQLHQLGPPCNLALRRGRSRISQTSVGNWDLTGLSARSPVCCDVSSVLQFQTLWNSSEQKGQQNCHHHRLSKWLGWPSVLGLLPRTVIWEDCAYCPATAAPRCHSRGAFVQLHGDSGATCLEWRSGWRWWSQTARDICDLSLYICIYI